MSQVKLYVYDLSNGLAAAMSEAFIGQKIDAIYHTSIVVFNHEYFYDQQQITVCPTPGQTRFGTPMRIVDLGETELDPGILSEYLNELQTDPDSRFKYGSYDLFYNNCNHFSNELAQFLSGCEIDHEILSLPDRVLSSPNGALIRQMFFGMAP